METCQRSPMARFSALKKPCFFLLVAVTSFLVFLADNMPMAVPDSSHDLDITQGHLVTIATTDGNEDSLEPSLDTSSTDRPPDTDVTPSPARANSDVILHENVHHQFGKSNTDVAADDVDNSNEISEAAEIEFPTDISDVNHPDIHNNDPDIIDNDPDIIDNNAEGDNVDNDHSLLLRKKSASPRDVFINTTEVKGSILKVNETNEAQTVDSLNNGLQNESLRNPSDQIKNYNLSVVLARLPIGSLISKSVKGTIMDYLPDYRNPCWFQYTTDRNGLKCLPYFYVLGVGKCGTTEMYNQLIKHPDIVPPRKKELFFWNLPHLRIKFKKYLELFDDVSENIFDQQNASGYHNKITFDATPSYFTNHGALHTLPGNYEKDEPKYTIAHTLYTMFQKARLLVILREPTERLFSHYHHFNHKHFSSADFHARARVGLEAMRRCLSQRSLRSCVFDNDLNLKIRQGMKIMLHYSMYYPYVKEWLSVFPRDQIMFIKADEFYANATKIMADVFRFLGLAESPPGVMRSIDYAMSLHYKTEVSKDESRDSYRMRMSNETREMLDEFFAPYNVKLAKLLSDDKWLFKSNGS